MARAVSAALGLAVAIAAAVPGRAQGIDVNQTGDSAEGLAWSWLRVVQDSLVFGGDDGLHGIEPWVSDGATIELLADVYPGLDGSTPSNFVDLNGTMLFSATGPGTDCELWAADLVTGDANLVVDASSIDYCPGLLTVAGNYVYFVHNHPSNGVELMRSDGTAPGTVWFDVNPGPDGSQPNALTAVGDTLYFIADNGVDGRELHRVLADGTLELVADIRPGPDSPVASGLTAVGASTVAFRADDGTHGSELWRSDGVTTTMVEDINPGSLSSTPVDLFLMSPGVLVFRARGSGVGSELWQSDGATATMIKDINPSGDSVPGEFTLWNGQLWFVADDGTTGRELWTSDTTGPGTALVADINPSGDSGIVGLHPLASRLAIIVDPSGISDDELWATDGTAGGTEHVATFEDIDQYSVAVKDGVLYFMADDGVIGNELWRSDGTAGNTRPVFDHVDPGSHPENLVWTGSELHFIASDGANGRELWASDGTDGGTGMITDLDPTGSAFPFTTELVSFDGITYFQYNDPALGRELYKTDGTDGGTAIVVDLEPGAHSSSPANLFAGPSHLFWEADHPDNVTELMATDGFTVTRLDTNPSGDDDPREMITLGTTVLLSALGDGVSRELFATDGTPTGTALVLDIDPTGSSLPEDFGQGLGRVFFSARTTDGSEPWVTDGTAAGTLQLGDLFPGADDSHPRGFVEAGRTVFFAAEDDVVGASLWTTDGTVTGTARIFDLDPNDLGGLTEEIAPAGDVVVFQLDSDAHGTELGVSDGTTAGTHLLVDIRPGPQSSDPEQLTTIGGEVYFTADDGIHGRELWVTDGTVAGTRLAWDVNPGPSRSDIDGVVAAGEDSLFFAANDSVIGQELFRYAIPLFADGFETNDTSAWSSTTP